jgi:hypothetical protein
MPVFPRTNSNRQITSSPGAPLESGAAERATAVSAPIVDALGQINEKWQVSLDNMQETAVKLNAETAHAKAENDAINDTDINGEQARIDELKKSSEEALKGVTNKQLQSQLKMQLDHATVMTGLKIKGIYKKKQVSADHVNTEKYLDDLAGNGGLLNEATAKKTIDDKVALRFYEREDGDKLFKKYQDNSIDYDIAKDMATSLNESYVYQELKKGKNGLYKNLSVDTLGKSLDGIQKKIRRNQILGAFNMGQNQDKNEANLLVQKESGTITTTQIKDMILNQDIRRNFGEKLLDTKENAPALETKKSAFNKAMEMGLNGKTTGEINQYLLDNTDKITPQDLQGILEQASVVKDKKSAERLKYNSDALKVWAVKNMGSPELAEEVVFDFFQRVQQDKAQGESVDNIANDIVRTTIKKEIPQTALMSDIPNFVANRKRIKRINAKASKLKSTSPKSNVSMNTPSSGVSFDEL